MAGPAFNPWQQGPAVGWGSGAPQVQAPAYGDTYSSPGSYLPSPPPGRIESRLVAIPQRGDPPGTPRALIPSAATPAPPAPPPAPIATPQVVEPARPPEPVPIVRQPEPARPAPAAPPAVASVAPTPPPPVASIAPPPPRPEPTTPPPSNALTIATVSFAAQSAEISDAAKSELDRVAKNLAGFRQIEVRAYAAAGGDPTESRKVALARALVVRSYLIDQGVKTRIEIGAFTSGGERVDIMGSSN